MMHRSLLFICCIGSLAMTAPAMAQWQDTTVYFDDFDAGPTAAAGVNHSMGGYVNYESVRGLAGYGGSTSGTFSGNFLRNVTGSSIGHNAVTPLQSTTLTLNNLPEHDALSLGMLFAAVDSWDSQWLDAFRIRVDGATVFDETFNWQPHNYAQSFPTSEAIAYRVDAGWSHWQESAYDLGNWNPLQHIPHTGDSVTIEFTAHNGYNGQFGGGDDESWAVDNLKITTRLFQQPANLQQTLAYSNDFDGNETFHADITGGLGGAGTATGVQGFNNITDGSLTFSGNLLRNSTGLQNGGVQATTLTLNNLPEHTAVSLEGLLAIIDSWDGDLRGDTLFIQLDGQTVFSETFQWQSNESQSAPTSLALALRQELGWVNGWPDSAYSFADFADLQYIPHTADSLTLSFYTNSDFGGSDADESWGLENLRVVLEGVPQSQTIPAPLAVIAAVGLVIIMPQRKVQ